MKDEVFYEIALRYLANTATEEEKQLLQQYLLTTEYSEKYSILLETFQSESININDEFSLERGLKMLRYKIQQSEKRKVFKLRKSLAIAATIVTFLGLGILLKSTFFNAKTINYVSVTSPAGERINIVLPDSSVIFLNSGATIKYPEQFEANERNVQLTGEAFFQVKRNVNKPFIVHSGNFTTTVLGTSFNVVNNNRKFQVTVRSGKVKVENTVSKKQFILEKNTQVVFNSVKDDLIKESVDAKIYTDWHKNILRFDAITAKEAFKRIEQWYNVKVCCESEAILNRRIRASYEDEPIDKVLKSMEFMIGIQYTIEKDSILIK